ncbi:hypothetical protein NMD1_01751 [Novosphingobium sp. MD-1]|nr:hypothetical protein NMD1_01751 [Novosphingobium sp. MD-1]
MLRRNAALGAKFETGVTASRHGLAAGWHWTGTAPARIWPP